MRKSKLFIIGLLVVIGLGFVFEYFLVQRDINKYVPPGQFVSRNGELMHLFSIGNGEQTIVLIPGMGTASPYVDFQPLWSRLSSCSKVIVIERYGYGFSDISKTERTLENIIKEMNLALKEIGEEPPFILVGHSLGGTISLAYAMAFPDEVSNIVMLDAALPMAFNEWSPPSQPINSVIPFIRASGLARAITSNSKIMGALRSQQDQYKDVPKDLWDIDRSILVRRTMNSNVKAEIQLFNRDIEEYNYEVPTLFISTPGLYKYVPGSKEAQADYITKALRSELIELDGEHYIHHYFPDEICEAIMNFIIN